MSHLNKIIASMNTKSKSSAGLSLLLGGLAGASIGLGAFIYTLMISSKNYDFTHKFMGSLLFSIGLIIIVFTKTQLFTGNNLMFISLFKKQIQLSHILKNWFYVYLGNFIGALVFALAVYFLLVQFSAYELSDKLVQVANKKVSLSFALAFYKATLCNFLVCSAVFLATISQNLTGKILGIIIPITAFVFFGFEHSIANMFFIPLGLAFKGGFSIILIGEFLSNIVPVTFGNIAGGAIFSTVILKICK